MVFSCACLFTCAGLGVACPCCPLLVKGFAVWLVVCRRLGLLRETTSYVVAPRLTCLPSALRLCGARSLGRLCASHTLPCARLLVVPWAGGCGGECGDWKRADRSQVGAMELRQEQLVAYGRNCGVVPGASRCGCPGQATAPRLRRPGRVSYYQASASWSPGGRPCHPAVPGCVVIVGKGPWSCEQRLGVVSSVRCGAPIVRTAWCCVPLPMGAWDVLTPCACDVCAFASHLRSGAHVECPGAVVAPL